MQSFHQLFISQIQMLNKLHSNTTFSFFLLFIEKFDHFADKFDF